MTDRTIDAECRECGHVEPRPEHTLEDWQRCERCGAHPSSVVPLEEDALFIYCDYKGWMNDD